MKVVPVGWPFRCIAARSALCALSLVITLPSVVVQASPAQAQEQRVALVIGNSHYDDGVAALTNPANDATDVADALRSMNFEVTALYDLSERDFHRALQKFSRDAASARTALVYYAGHAMHLDDESYLMPVGVRVEDKADVKFEMVSVENDIIRRTLADVPVKILILDACRDNPIAKQIAMVDRSRSVGDVRGLAPIVQATSGMLIAYATSPNQVAEDGQGRNSPFTKALKKHIREPGVDVQTMLAEVSADVRQATNDRQRPEISDALPRGFFLSPGESDAVVWDGIKSTRDVAELKDFVRRFPTSRYVGEANAKVEVLLVQEQLEQFKREAALRDEAARRQVDEAKAAAEALQRADAAAKEAARQQAAADAEAKRLATEQDAARKEDERKAEVDRVAAARTEAARQDVLRHEADRLAVEKAAAAQAVQAEKQRLEAEKAAAAVHQPSPEELARQRDRAEKDRVAAAQAQAAAREAARQRAEREAVAERARAQVERRRREAATAAADAAAEARAARRAAEVKAAQAERAVRAASVAHRAAQDVAVRSRRTEHVERASVASPHSCFNFNGKSYCE